MKIETRTIVWLPPRIGMSLSLEDIEKLNIKETKNVYAYDDDGLLRFKVAQITPEVPTYELELRSASGNIVSFVYTDEELWVLHDVLRAAL